MQHSLRLRAYNLLRERFNAVQRLESITPEDVIFIKEELVDVLEMVAEHLQEKASIKLERTLMAIKLLQAELGHGQASAVSIPVID
jgi:hypothetical protein